MMNETQLLLNELLKQEQQETDDILDEINLYNQKIITNLSNLESILKNTKNLLIIDALLLINQALISLKSLSALKNNEIIITKINSIPYELKSNSKTFNTDELVIKSKEYLDNMTQQIPDIFKRIQENKEFIKQARKV